jgi:hypothetical protein
MHFVKHPHPSQKMPPPTTAELLPRQPKRWLASSASLVEIPRRAMIVHWRFHPPIGRTSTGKRRWFLRIQTMWIALGAKGGSLWISRSFPLKQSEHSG